MVAVIKKYMFCIAILSFNIVTVIIPRRRVGEVT